MIGFQFDINKSFLNYKWHPITIPKRFYGDIEKEGLLTNHQEISIICPDGAHVSGYIYSSSAGFGPFCQIRSHSGYRNPVESLKVGDQIQVEIIKDGSTVTVALKNKSEHPADAVPVPSQQPKTIGKAVDFDITNDKPDRDTIQVNRIIRDTKMAVEIKELYHYVCQICGYYIEFEDGRRYAEAHHIKPLGSPHNGPDSRANILCLCPNCHAKLDFGIIELNAQKINYDAQQHSLGCEFIEYHNAFIFRKI